MRWGIDMGTVGVGRFDWGAAASDLAHVPAYGRGRAQHFSNAIIGLAQPYGILEKHDPHDAMTILPKVISLSTGQYRFSLHKPDLLPLVGRACAEGPETRLGRAR
jgi:hypothetical protein